MMESRVDVYKFIKKAYTVRSNYFHGKSSISKIPLIEISAKLDNIIRWILIRVITKDKKVFLQTVKNGIQDAFLDLMLGAIPLIEKLLKSAPRLITSLGADFGSLIIRTAL